MSENPARPVLSPALSGAELRRWYWTVEELTRLARTLGVRTGGNKAVLTDRVAAALDGIPFVEPSTPRTHGAQLSAPLTGSMRIPPGQRCGEPMRAWFAEQVGRPFRFDAAMRSFFAGADGTQTLDDALQHHRATRGAAPEGIDAQFEYNRFTRQWREEHPRGDRRALLAAWWRYRRQPVDVRDRA